MVKNGKPMFQYRTSNQPKFLITLQSPKSLPPGAHSLTVDFKYDGGGIGKGGNFILSVDGIVVGQKRIEVTIPFRFSLDETWDVGEDIGTPVDFDTYDTPFKFTGELKKLTVDLIPSTITKADEQKIKEGERLAELARE
jgi:arylsulfatase